MSRWRGAFFGGDEPGFVNAALDTIARRKRAAEFGLPTPKASWISDSLHDDGF